MIENAKNPVLFFSGGLESSLLLYLLAGQSIPVVTFSEDWTKEQRRRLEEIVLRYDLTLYTFPPRNRYFVPNQNGISLVDEYGFGGEIVPVIRDIEDSETGCVAELSQRRFDNFDFGFQTVITGALKEDRHDLVGNPMGKEKIQGKVKFICPLWEMSKEQVRAKVFRLDLPIIEETGELKMCNKCLTESAPFCHLENKIISPVKWNPVENLVFFRERFNYAS